MRNDYAHNRLTLWALWWSRCHGGGSIATASLEARVDGDGWDAPTVIRNIDAEAEQTDRAVASLEDAVQQAVRVFYCGPGNAERKARKLGISGATLYLRVDQGTHAVARWLDDQQRAAKSERDRVEALQRTSADKHPTPTAEPEPAPDRTGSTLATHLARIRAARGFPT